MTKIGIFIPCYNVANSITKVLNSFSPATLAVISEVVVVDNCSQDKTFQILRDIQVSGSPVGNRLVIIKNKENYGLGGSQKIAYRYFLTEKFSHFLIVHGDNQGNGEEIAQKFLKSFREKFDLDLIVASRFTKSSDVSRYNRLRVAGNYLFNFLTYVLTGENMTDSGAAILFYRTEILENFPFEHLTNSFQFNPELNILLYKDKRLKILEVPLNWSDSDDKSNIRAMNYCWTLLKILMRFRWNKTFMRKSGWALFHRESQAIMPQFEIIRTVSPKF